jgi:hypothetical protein
VQDTVTLPGEDETMRIDGLTSSDLSILIDGTPTIGDPRRRSYVVTARGQQAMFYLMLRARAQLRFRARCASITFVPYIDRLAELSLRKSATITDWRLPGGTATGKITAFSCTLTPPTDAGGVSVQMSATIGCAVGNGGTIAGAGGTADYVQDDYIDQDEDWQEYIGQMLVFNDDVSFTVPLYDPNDDGLDFINGLGGTNNPAIFEVPITITEESADQGPFISNGARRWAGSSTTIPGPVPQGFDSWSEARQAALADRNAATAYDMSQVHTVISFKLKDLKGEFETTVPIVVQDLKIPKMLDMSAT